ncbi:zinc finger protein 383-like isoform X3 [Thalassophryne amazonica]|uniref:zinc finger protein 383-like isoform X3 n=1 Tax=Thalassophryne amazonica TaxID=390379 RepID=UPI0014726961|nr:zinc finger protein 383-like isoform X3 [Thalassophryne amazonica]
MHRVKTEQVIVGSEMMPSPQIKSEPVTIPLQIYNNEKMQCFQCFITFSDPKAMERHMKQSHRELYNLQLQQTNTVFTCYNCDKSFSSSDELSQHQAIHSNEEKSFHCTYCVERFYTFSELTKHIRYECIKRQWPCRDCGIFFPSRSRYRHHRIVVHLHKEDEILQHQATFGRDTNCAIMRTEKARGHKPKKVPQARMTDSNKIKQEEEPVECDQNRDSLTKQQKTELKIPCPEESCELLFSSIEALRAHKKDRHGAAPFPRSVHLCTECNESYAQPNQARVHNSNRYNCSTCGKSFGRKSNLNAHQNTHMEGGGGAEK